MRDGGRGGRQDRAVIVVEAAIRLADPAGRDALVAASAPIQQATRDDEDGCLVYCFAADPVEADLIQVYELWTDEAALHAHFDHPNYHAMREMLNGAGLASADQPQAAHRRRESGLRARPAADRGLPELSSLRRPSRTFGPVS